MLYIVYDDWSNNAKGCRGVLLTLRTDVRTPCIRASNDGLHNVFIITEKVLTRAFSVESTFTFKTLC